ncbi:hypothetical protein J6590_075810, partial [Homalodisca vitripennis]
MVRKFQFESPTNTANTHQSSPPLHPLATLPSIYAAFNVERLDYHSEEPPTQLTPIKVRRPLHPLATPPSMTERSSVRATNTANTHQSSPPTPPTCYAAFNVGRLDYHCEGPKVAVWEPPTHLTPISSSPPTPPTCYAAFNVERLDYHSEEPPTQLTPINVRRQLHSLATPPSMYEATNTANTHQSSPPTPPTCYAAFNVGRLDYHCEGPKVAVWEPPTQLTPISSSPPTPPTCYAAFNVGRLDYHSEGPKLTTISSSPPTPPTCYAAFNVGRLDYHSEGPKDQCEPPTQLTPINVRRPLHSLATPPSMYEANTHQSSPPTPPTCYAAFNVGRLDYHCEGPKVAVWEPPTHLTTISSSPPTPPTCYAAFNVG